MLTGTVPSSSWSSLEEGGEAGKKQTDISTSESAGETAA